MRLQAAAASAIRYRRYRKLGEHGRTGQARLRLSASTLSYEVSGKTAGDEYRYRVQACYDSACGTWSNEYDITVVTLDAPVMSDIYTTATTWDMVLDWTGADDPDNDDSSVYIQHYRVQECRAQKSAAVNRIGKIL